MNIVNILFGIVVFLLFFCLNVCRVKNVPKDVVLFVCCLFAGILFLLGNINSLFSHSEFWWLFGPFVVFISAPLFYSFVYQNKKKEGVDS